MTLFVLGFFDSLNKGVLQNAATLPFAMKFPHPVDAGEVTDRPRAMDNHPTNATLNFAYFARVLAVKKEIIVYSADVADGIPR